MEEKKEDKRKQSGGARKGAGAPKKKANEQAKAIMRKAVRMLYNKDEDQDEEAQVEFLKDFAATPRGQQFIAEHLFGKAPQVIEAEEGSVIAVPTIVFK